jgi:hypothetical protein
MKTFYHIVISLLLYAPCLGAQENGVEVRPNGIELLETEPRRIATAVFQVTNETSEKEKFLSEVKLPQGWMLVAESPSFCLGPNESDTRLVSFLIPQTALAGQYELTYLVKAEKHPSITDSSTIDVVVLPVRKLDVKLLEAPEFVIAGQDYQASFAVINGSNTESKVSIKIDSGENLPFAVDAEEFELTPGESKRLEVVVSTDVNRKELLRYHLRLTAQTLKDQEVKAQATSYVEILPRTTGTLERFHKIPTELTFSYVTKRNGEHDAGFQTTVSGSGTSDEDETRGVRFFFRGPDVQDKSIFGRYDEYRLTFWTRYYELRFGDLIHSLSPLIENYRYGRGIEGKLNLNNFRVGAYHMETRWFEPEEVHIAGYVDYLILDNFQIGLNYLNKEIDGEDENIASIECRLGPIGNTSVELEYATGEKNREGSDAYLLGVSSRWNWFSFASRFVHAEPDCPAHYRDRDFISSGLAFRLKHNLRLKANFRQEKKNLDLDPTLNSAPLEKSYKLGFDYRLKTGTSFYAYWRDRSREDRLPNSEFRYREETVVFGLGQSFKKLRLNASAESGQRKDELSNQFSRLDRYKVYAYFRPTHKLSSSGYIYSDDSGDYAEERRRRITAGLNSSLRISNSTNFSLNFQTSDYEGSPDGDRDVLELRLSHRFRNQSEIQLRGRRTSYGSFGGQYESAFKVEVTIPFGLPAARKKDIGRIRGYVYDEENEQPISDAILKIDGTTAVTDKKGKFSFPALKPGIHYLDVSTARIGLDRITVQKTPRELIVEGGKETRVEVGITRSASLIGQVMLYGHENNHNNEFPGDMNGNLHVVGEGDNNGSFINGESKLVQTQGIANILVELRNGSEVMRRLTNREGRFEFEEVRPREWTLKIYEDDLPKYHYFESDTFNLELNPGERKEVLVKVLPKKRSINIIDKGEILLEEEKK